MNENIVISPEIYQVALITLGLFLTYFGAYLIFGRIPNDLRKSVYTTSRRLMGSAFLVLAIAIFIFFAMGIDDLSQRYRIALNISCYHIAAKLFTASFVTLIGVEPVLYKFNRYKLYSILTYTFPFIVWFTLFINDHQILMITQVSAGLMLLFGIMVDIAFFFRNYRRALVIGEYCYADGVGVHISWMIKSVYSIVGVGITSSVVALLSWITPQWVLFLYLIYFVGVCMYIFSKLLHFTTIFSDMAKQRLKLAPSEEFLLKQQLSSEMYHYLQKQTLEWVGKKKFCNNKVTIITASSQIGTNRSYLSIYINTTYQCSFKLWVSKLRINEAKDLMVSKPQMTITAIAKQVGFVSLTSFTHAFKSLEGVSPKEWARVNRLQISDDLSRDPQPM